MLADNGAFQNTFGFTPSGGFLFWYSYPGFSSNILASTGPGVFTFGTWHWLDIVITTNGSAGGSRSILMSPRAALTSGQSADSTLRTAAIITRTRSIWATSNLNSAAHGSMIFTATTTAARHRMQCWATRESTPKFQKVLAIRQTGPRTAPAPTGNALTMPFLMATPLMCRRYARRDRRLHRAHCRLLELRTGWCGAPTFAKTMLPPTPFRTACAPDRPTPWEPRLACFRAIPGSTAALRMILRPAHRGAPLRQTLPRPSSMRPLDGSSFDPGNHAHFLARRKPCALVAGSFTDFGSSSRCAFHLSRHAAGDCRHWRPVATARH